jgi:quercetin dioxygenase-like cupin family protein
MHYRAPIILFVLAASMLACTSDPPVAPGSAHHMDPGLDVAAPDPFTYRAPLDPYQIHELPAFLMQSTARTDIVMQRSVFAPGPGMWHTHPGPSFVYLIEGNIQLDRFSPKDGCTETPVFGPGQAYMEIANQVHRAVVTSAEPAVVVVTRFNIPVGSPITIPANDPGC